MRALLWRYHFRTAAYAQLYIGRAAWIMCRGTRARRAAPTDDDETEIVTRLSKRGASGMPKYRKGTTHDTEDFASRRSCRSISPLVMAGNGSSSPCQKLH